MENLSFTEMASGLRCEDTLPYSPPSPFQLHPRRIAKLFNISPSPSYFDFHYDSNCDSESNFSVDLHRPSVSPFLRVLAPMVRYSRYPLRSLCYSLGWDICFTPMIITKSFAECKETQRVEFFWDFMENKNNNILQFPKVPMVTQFAIRSGRDYIDKDKESIHGPSPSSPIDLGYLLHSIDLVSPYSSGIDINCGCPQPWAIRDGMGANLLSHVEVLGEYLKKAKLHLGADKTLSVKIRLLESNAELSSPSCSFRRTYDFLSQISHCGADFISIHCRNVHMRREKAIHNAIRMFDDICPLPFLANGDFSSQDICSNLWNQMREKNPNGMCEGFMTATEAMRTPWMWKQKQWDTERNNSKKNTRTETTPKGAVSVAAEESGESSYSLDQIPLPPLSSPFPSPSPSPLPFSVNFSFSHESAKMFLLFIKNQMVNKFPKETSASSTFSFSPPHPFPLHLSHNVNILDSFLSPTLCRSDRIRWKESIGESSMGVIHSVLQTMEGDGDMEVDEEM